MVDDRAAVVDHVAGGVLMVAQVPQQAVDGVFVGEDLVDGGAVQEPVQHRSVGVQHQADLTAVPDVAFRAVERAIAVVIDLLHHAAVEGVVGVGHDLRRRAAGRVAVFHARQPVAMVPRVEDRRSGGDVRARGAVPFAVIRVVERAVGEQPVVADAAAGRLAIAGGVEVERLTGRSPTGVARCDRERGRCQLMRVVVAIDERPFGSREAGRSPVRVVGPRVTADARTQRRRSGAHRRRSRMPVLNLLDRPAVEVPVNAGRRLGLRPARAAHANDLRELIDASNPKFSKLVVESTLKDRTLANFPTLG